MKKTLILLSLMLFAVLPGHAQEGYDRYLQDVGSRALLWRGHLARRYPPLSEGTPWWTDARFLPGSVVYNGKHYAGVWMNIDAVQQDLVVTGFAGDAQKVLRRDCVERFSLGGWEFVNLQALHGASMPAGYWQAVYDGRAKVYRQVVKNLKKDYSGRRWIEETVAYGHLSDNGKWTPLRRRSQLSKLYPEHRKDLQRHIAQLESGGMLEFERFCVAVMSFVESREPVATAPAPSVLVDDFTRAGSPGLPEQRSPLPYGYFVATAPVAPVSDSLLRAESHRSGLDTVSEEALVLKSAVVTADRVSHHRTAQMSVELVRVEAIKHVPVVFGESDPLKVVMTLPGVKSVGEAAGGFNVRGGSTDQNLILLNEGTLYNPNHMFGILSAFNTDIINEVELYKSSIPARYGGRISSVLEVTGRDGNSQKIQGSLGLGLLTSRLHLEGPVVKDRTTFILGGRTTYSNWMLRLLPESSQYGGGRASFQDLNLGLRHKVNEKNTLSVYGYFSRDKFSFSGDTTFRYRNLNGSLKWESNFSDRHSMTLAAGYDSYHYSLEDTFNDHEAYRLANAIDQGFAKLRFNSLPGDKHQLQYGLTAIYYDLNPGAYLPASEVSLVDPRYLDRERAVEAALYISDTWTPSDAISLDLGLRWSQFLPVGGEKSYGGPEFRLSGKYSFNDVTSVKAGFNTMRQYIHMISNSVNISPVDSWRLSSDRIRPQTGWQAAAGFYRTLWDDQLDLSLEGYYKRVQHYIDYKEGAVLVMNPQLADDLVETENRSYGVELMAKKVAGKLNGWVSYTWSRSKLRETGDRGEDAINGGAWYNAPYDKPHDVKLVANYRFTHRYSLSVNLDYATGRPVTLPIGQYEYGDGIWLVYSDRNSYRIPDYFRLDLALIIEPSHYLKQLTHMSFTIGCYNVTGRKNPYSVYFSSDGTSVTGHMLSVFAVPVPYVNLNLKF